MWDQNQVSCWYGGPIDPSGAAPELQITIAPAAGISQLVTEVSVIPKGAVEGSPADNTVTTTTPLANFKLTGGGLGCHAAPVGSFPTAGAGLVGALLGLLGVRRRRR